MNLRISHGQATRSTFTFSRVTHFMLSLLLHYAPAPISLSWLRASRTRCKCACSPPPIPSSSARCKCPLVSLPRLKNGELRFDRDARSLDHIHWPLEPARRIQICATEMQLIIHSELPCLGLYSLVSVHSFSAVKA